MGNRCIHPWNTWQLGHFCVAILAATVLSAVVNIVRRRALTELDQARKIKEEQSEVLAMALDHAEAASQAADNPSLKQSEFLAKMSHEILTPMNGVIGMTDLALETELSYEQTDYLKAARGSAEVLLSILKDILDLSQIDSGKMDIEPSEFSPRKLTNDTLEPYRRNAKDRGLTLGLSIDTSVPDRIVTDPIRYHQVLSHIVDNALKFTERGGLEIRVEPGDAGFLQTLVSDTGIGMTPEQQNRVFGAFEQRDNSITRSPGGAGLGLAIGARLVALMGGEIGCKSTLGVGSTFWFTVPYGAEGSDFEASSLSSELGVAVISETPFPGIWSRGSSETGGTKSTHTKPSPMMTSHPLPRPLTC